MKVADEETELYEWLCPSAIDPEEQQELRRAERTIETGKWIFKHPTYDQWLNEPSSFLWLHGQSIAHLGIKLTC
jgi:hypothetical protein